MHIFYTFLNYFEYVFWFILVFTLIVFIHEFGHYYIAKINKVDIEKFSIGFGPVLFSKTDKNNTKWQVAAIPLGGYVKFSGEMYSDKNNNSDNNKRLFMNKSALQKASIVIAGPLANFILSFIIFLCLFIFFGKNSTPNVIGYIEKNSPAELSELKIYDKIIGINNISISNFEDIYDYLDNKKKIDKLYLQVERETGLFDISLSPIKKTIETFIGTERTINYLGISPSITPIIGKILPNAPAYKAGLLKNDIIISINKKQIMDIKQVINIIQNNLNKDLEIIVLRGDRNLIINLIPLDLSNNKKGQIGIVFKKNRQKLNFVDATNESLNNIYEISKKTLVAFSEILFGKRNHCEVGGPILIAKVSNDVANTDLVSFIALIALISINLGLINLFPLPLLDGGHFVTYISEFIYGRNINYNFFKVLQSIGVILIVSFMLFSILNDIYCRVLN